MKYYLLFLFFLGVITGCQRKKYNPKEYEVNSQIETTSEEDASYNELRNHCLTFLNYCDKNYTDDLKLFARDWIRTWDGWETEGVHDYGHSLLCHISTKNKFDHRSSSFKVEKETEPPFFEAELSFYNTNYDDLVNMVRREFGQPNLEKETQYGTAYIWKSGEKSISTVPGQYSSKFVLEYPLNINMEQ